MRNIATFISLLLITASASTTNTHIAASTKKPVFVKGTYLPGSNITEPRPRESQFLSTDHAGFVVVEKGAAYYLQARVRKAPPSTYYIRVEYENPKDKSHPFVNDMDLKPDMEGVRFSSSDVVWGIRNYQDYTIRVKVFASRESTEPVDTLVQQLRAYVDTTTSEVRIYNRMREK